MTHICFLVPLVRMQDLNALLPEEHLQIAQSVLAGVYCILPEGDSYRLLHSKDLTEHTDKTILFGGEALQYMLDKLDVHPPLYSSLSVADILCRARTEAELTEMIHLIWTLEQYAYSTKRLSELKAPLIIRINYSRMLYHAFSEIWDLPAMEREPRMDLHLAAPVVLREEYCMICLVAVL